MDARRQLAEIVATASLPTLYDLVRRGEAPALQPGGLSLRLPLLVLLEPARLPARGLRPPLLACAEAPRHLVAGDGEGAQRPEAGRGEGLGEGARHRVVPLLRRGALGAADSGGRWRQPLPLAHRPLGLAEPIRGLSRDRRAGARAPPEAWQALPLRGPQAAAQGPRGEVRGLRRSGAREARAERSRREAPRLRGRHDDGQGARRGRPTQGGRGEDAHRGRAAERAWRGAERPTGRAHGARAKDAARRLSDSGRGRERRPRGMRDAAHRSPSVARALPLSLSLSLSLSLFFTALRCRVRDSQPWL
mmetsp:Transcript_100733/g.280634  ORF Transcript_100733/g.280634 Transcript_100733/m.280634 type:complete len:305 (-) Transcript_100733:46-960(-)